MFLKNKFNAAGVKPVHIWQCNHPDSKVHGANMGPIWGRQDIRGPHVGPINFAIWAALLGRPTSYNTIPDQIQPWVTWSTIQYDLYTHIRPGAHFANIDLV